MGLNPINGAIPLSTILRALVEPFRTTSKSETDDESVHSYLTRRFGKGVAKLASAGMHGIYAASLEDLSAKAILGRVFDWESEYGSVIWGMFRDKKSLKRVMERKDEEGRWAQLGEIGRDREDWAMYGLKGGIGTLTGRLEGFIKDQGGVEVRLGESVRGLKSTPEGVEVGRKSLLCLGISLLLGTLFILLKSPALRSSMTEKKSTDSRSRLPLAHSKHHTSFHPSLFQLWRV